MEVNGRRLKVTGPLGAMEHELPDVLEAELDADTVWVVETNLDDTTPEIVADASERLMAAGAVDVFTTAVTMKKGRTGLMLSCLVHEAERPAAVSYTHLTLPTN